MRQNSRPSEHVATTKRKPHLQQNTFCLLLIVSSLLLEPSLADPETVKGLLADNINHQKVALNTQKKQYSLKTKLSTERNNLRSAKRENTKQKLHEIQAQKHQKLLDAIEENAFPKVVNSPSNKNLTPSPIQRLYLKEANNRIKNKFATDLASRNINFLNERARPPQNQQGQPLLNYRNENRITESDGSARKNHPNLHPDTIGRISYRGKNGQASRPFGKFLKGYPNLLEPQWKDFSSQFPRQFQQLPSFQRSSIEENVISQPNSQRSLDLPNETFNENSNGGPYSMSDDWNGRVNSIKEGPSSSTKTENHKWPIQPSANGVVNNPISNKIEKPREKFALPKLRSNVKSTKGNLKELPETKLPSKTIPNSDKNEMQGDLREEKDRSKDEQNLNQIPENSNTERSPIKNQPVDSSPVPVLPYTPGTTNKLKENLNPTPKLEMLKADKKGFDFEHDSSNSFSERLPAESFSALIIGLTFVVIFIVMAFGLVGHTIYNKFSNCGERDEKNNYFGRKGRFMRSPDEEDRTPPELRTGMLPSFVQPDPKNTMNGGYCGSRSGGPNGATKDQNGANHPFLNGKLILHELNSNSSMQSKHPMNGMNSQIPTMRSQSNSKYLGLGIPGEHLGAIPKKMPSPAANVQVTDDLISPKYDDKDGNDHQDDSTESEEEDSSDDTVYECPGLAASSGDDIVVANPFFMPGQNFTPLVPTKNSPAHKARHPISKNENIFHQGIAGLN